MRSLKATEDSSFVGATAASYQHKTEFSSGIFDEGTTESELVLRFDPLSCRFRIGILERPVRIGDFRPEIVIDLVAFLRLRVNEALVFISVGKREDANRARRTLTCKNFFIRGEPDDSRQKVIVTRVAALVPSAGQSMTSDHCWDNALSDQKAGSAHGFANPFFYMHPGSFYDVLSVKTAVDAAHESGLA